METYRPTDADLCNPWFVQPALTVFLGLILNDLDKLIPRLMRRKVNECLNLSLWHGKFVTGDLAAVFSGHWKVRWILAKHSSLNSLKEILLDSKRAITPLGIRLMDFFRA